MLRFQLRVKLDIFRGSTNFTKTILHHHHHHQGKIGYLPFTTAVILGNHLLLNSDNKSTVTSHWMC